MAKLKNKNKIKEFSQSVDFIDVEIAAAHLDFVNGNSFLYKTSAAKDGIDTWTKPFNKPQLINHDKHHDPLGRCIGATVVTDSVLEDEPPNFVKLHIRLSDSDAIEKVLKGLYNTVSVGSKTTKVHCSVCKQEFTEEGLCEHEKGTTTDSGKHVYWIIDEIQYKEDSFVNMPADPYSRILRLNIGNGWLLYKDFLENQDALISELMMEDNSMIVKDAQLSTAARNKLSDSAFCGPGRSFPAHDQAHVQAGLRLLNNSKFSDSTKAKIKACLYRKGKKYGITPSDEEYTETPNILTYRIGDVFTDEETKQVTDFFDQSPNALYELEDEEPVVEPVADAPVEDKPTEDKPVEDAPVEDKPVADVVEPVVEPVVDTEKADLIAAAEVLKQEIATQKDEIKQLNSRISDFETILNTKEDEISQLVDELALSVEDNRQALVAHIVDVKKIKDNLNDEAVETVREKYNQRRINSLVDTINDLHVEVIVAGLEDNKIEDPTLSNDNVDTGVKKVELKDSVEIPEGLDPRFAPFYAKHRETE